MEHVVYILYSPKYKKNYTGESSSIIARFHSHISLATKGWTIRYRPWILVHIEFFENRKLAIKKEKWFKTRTGKRYKDKIIRKFLLNEA